MRLYTATGDGGETSLFDGTRVAKDHPRVVAYGDVDELNSVLGWCRCAPPSEQISSRIERIQHLLFDLGAELATPPGSRQSNHVPKVGEASCRELEGWIDQASDAVPPLRNFVLPGGCEPASRLHLARTCCRRSERAVIALARAETVRPEAIIFLNRLSDLLFAWAREANHLAGCGDQVWVAST